MRVARAVIVISLLGAFLISSDAGGRSFPSSLSLHQKPNQLIGESLKDGVTPYEFFKALPKINTFSGYEKFFRRKTTHNPLVFRQGGNSSPQVAPTATAIPGPPYDIHTPTGTIPGCLNQLCPPPNGALWYVGTCWCTP